MFFILSIGTATVDYIIRTDASRRGSRICFEAGRKYAIEAPRMRAGGDALNAAVSFARAGFVSALVSEWGTDTAGSFLERVIRKEHIRPHITRTRTHPSATSFIFVSADGERTIFVSRGALREFSFQDVPQTALARARFAYLSTGVWSSDVVLRMLRALKKNRVSVVLSPSGYLLTRYRTDLSKLFAFSDIVVMNREEATLVSGIPGEHTKKVFSKLDALIPGLAVMTCGDKGAYVSNGTRLFYAPAFRVRDVVDKTGAGDAFGSGFLIGLLESEPRRVYGAPFQEENIIYGMHRGVANAASVVEHMGATEGILTTKQFKTESRWKRCAVRITRI